MKREGKFVGKAPVPPSKYTYYIYIESRDVGILSSEGLRRPFIEKYVQWIGLTAILLCWWGKKYEANE